MTEFITERDVLELYHSLPPDRATVWMLDPDGNVRWGFEGAKLPEGWRWINPTSIEPFVVNEEKS
jgi:hypothetical protein